MKTKSGYPTEIPYREKTIVLVSENRSMWAALDEEGQPGKEYPSLSEVKAAIDRKLDAVVKKKFERFKFFTFDNPLVVYEATSVKLGGYGGPHLRGSVVEAPKEYPVYSYHNKKVGDKETFSFTGRYDSKIYFLDGNEDKRAALIAKDNAILALQKERKALPGGKTLTLDFLDKRGDLTED